MAATWASVPKGTALALASTINLGKPGATTPARYHYNGNLTLGGGASYYVSFDNVKVGELQGQALVDKLAERLSE